MRVQLDRAKKLVLIKALKAGYIDDGDIGGWFDRSTLTLQRRGHTGSSE